MGQAYAGMNRRDVLKTLGTVGALAALGHRPAAAADKLIVGVIYVGPSDDYGYNQAQAAGGRGHQEACRASRSSSRRRSPRPSTCRRPWSSHDRAGRRDAALPDLVRLLRSAHPHGWRRSIRRCRFAHCGGLWTRGQAPEERRQLLRLHRRVPVSQRRRRRPRQQVEEARLHRRQADPAGAAQHQRLHARRAQRGPEDHHAAHLHRRLVAAGEGGGGGEQPDRSGRGRASPATSTAPRSSSRPPSGAASSCCGYHANQATLAPKGYLTGAEWNWLTPYTDSRARTPRRASRWSNFLRGGLKEGFVKTSPYGNGGRRGGAEEGRRGEGRA